MGALDNTFVVLYDQFDNVAVRPHFVGPVANTATAGVPGSTGLVTTGRFGAAQGTPPAGAPYWVPIGATFLGPPINDYALRVDVVGTTLVVSDSKFSNTFPGAGFPAGYAYGHPSFPPFGDPSSGELAPSRVYDGNTNAPGYETILGVVLRKPVAGDVGVDASVDFGTFSDPVFVDLVETIADAGATAGAKGIIAVGRDDGGLSRFWNIDGTVTYPGAGRVQATGFNFGTGPGGGFTLPAGAGQSFITGGRFGGGQPATAAGNLAPIGASYIDGDYALKVDVVGASFTAAGVAFETPFGPGPNAPSTTGFTTGWWDRGTGPPPTVFLAHSPAFVYNVDPASFVPLPAMPAGTPENVVGVVLRAPVFPGDVRAFGTPLNPISVTGSISLTKDPFYDPFPAEGFGAGFLYDPDNDFGTALDNEMVPARVYDGDTNPAFAGKELILGTILRKATSGFSVPLGVTPDPASDPTTHPMRTEETRPTTAFVDRVVIAGAPATTTLLVANTARRGVILFNEGGGNVFVKLGAACTPTDYTVRIGPFGLFVLPEPVYTGDITAAKIGASAGGPVQVTETRPPSA